MGQRRMTVSDKIKDLLDNHDLTQAEVADAMGMKPTLLARMLRDRNHNYTVKTLDRIASAVGVGLSVEFTDTDGDTE